MTVFVKMDFNIKVVFQISAISGIAFSIDIVSVFSCDRHSNFSKDFDLPVGIIIIVSADNQLKCAIGYPRFCNTFKYESANVTSLLIIKSTNVLPGQ